MNPEPEIPIDTMHVKTNTPFFLKYHKRNKKVSKTGSTYNQKLDNSPINISVHLVSH